MSQTKSLQALESLTKLELRVYSGCFHFHLFKRSPSKMLRKFWRDQCGAVVSAEIVVIGTVLVIGVMVGWALLRGVIFIELSNQAQWIAGEEDQIAEIQIGEITVCSDVFRGNEGGP